MDKHYLTPLQKIYLKQERFKLPEKERIPLKATFTIRNESKYTAAQILASEWKDIRLLDYDECELIDDFLGKSVLQLYEGE